MSPGGQCAGMRLSSLVALFLLVSGAFGPSVCRAAEPARRFATPEKYRAWAPELRRADSLIWVYRAADAAREATLLRDRARAEKAAWPEMSASVLAAAAEGLLGRGAVAEGHARDGFRMARRLAEPEYERRAMRWLAFALEAQGRSAAAESTYRVLLRAATPARDTLHMGAAHLGIAYASLTRGSLGPARRHYERALPLLERARNPVLYATARVGLARTFHELGELESERRIYVELLAQARRANLGRNEVDALNNLGAIEYARGDAENAATYWRMAMERQRSMQAREPALVAVGNFVLALNDLGRFDEATAVLDSAIASGRAAGLREPLAQLEVRRGEMLIKQVRPTAALEAFRRAEALVPEGHVSLLSRVRLGIGRALSLVTSAQATLDYELEQVLPLAPSLGPLERFEVQQRVGDALLAAGRLRDAARQFGEAAQGVGAGGHDRSRVAVALYRQGCVLRQLGLTDSARVTLGRAVTEWERWRGEGRGSRWRELDTFTFSWLPVEYADAMLAGRDRDPRRLAEAWNVLQAGRSRAVLDQLTGAAPGARAAATLSLARVQSGVLAPGDLLLDYHAGQHGTLLFAITRSSVRLVRLPASDSLRAAMKAWYGLLSAAPSGAGAAGALEVTRARMADLLLSAVAPEIRASRRVFLSLDGAMSRVPVEGLVSVVAGDARVRDVMRVPSASVLARLRSQARNGSTRVLAWRGASDSAHPPLRGAEGEVAFLRRRIEGTSVRVGERSPALPSQADLAPWGVLHFAAHARTLEQFPWESGLLCADSVAATSSPWLTARQISGMRLGARLAVLSGCGTASGRVRGGEGVMGLVSAFHSAGVPCVVASLWAVDDVATARLAEVFYERLLAGDTVAGALERGRAALRAEPSTAHPWYWAGFVVSGDGAQRVPLRARGFGSF